MITTPAEHQRLLRLATRASVAVAGILVASALAWWLSGSVSLLAGLTDSALDAVASFLNLLAVHYALRPADDDHRFGHGKAEALAGMAQALFIGVSAVLIGVQAVERLHTPQPLGDTSIGIAVMLLSLVLTVALLAFQYKVIRLTGSTAIRADSLHYRRTCCSIAASCWRCYWPVSAGRSWMRCSAWALPSTSCGARCRSRASIAILMDKELPGDGREMAALVLAIPGVKGVHDLRTRLSGNQWFVQLHLDLPGQLPLHDAHELCVEASRVIRQRYPQADVMVHADPV